MINRKIIKLYLMFKYGFIWKKPAYLKRLIAIYIKIGIKKDFMPVRGVDFALNYTCNLRCEHCFDQTLIKSDNSKTMLPNDYKRVAEEAMKLGCTYFGFQGGELFLRKDYLDAIKSVYPDQNRITVTSNGLVVDEEKIKNLKNAGVDYMIFSIDSGIAEEHDKFRGVKGTFDKVMNAVRLCKKLDMKFTINTTISHHNVKTKGFKKIVEFAEKNKVFVNTLFASPAGNWEKNTDVILNEDDKRYYAKMRKKYPFMVRDLDASFKGWGCPAAKEVFYITPYGDILGCPFIQVSLGNIFNESFEVIKNRARKIKHFSYFPDKCLMAEDKNFVNEYFSFFDEKDQLPIPLRKTNW